MSELDDCRAEIDRIDDGLRDLLVRRFGVSEKVAELKRRDGAAVSDPQREREILYRITDGVGDEYMTGLRQLFTSIFGISKAMQRCRIGAGGALLDEIAVATTQERFPQKAVVAVPGVEGSYAHQAASKMFPIASILNFNGFEKVFEAVESGLCPYGILPLENSAAGSVTAVYDLMRNHSFHIVRALSIKVDHVLLAAKGTKLGDITTVASHPHALAQCSAFLKRHPAMRAEPGPNTAAAAKELSLSGEKGRAVIASRACAELYGLDIVADDICDAQYNHTRFICIAKDLDVRSDANKVAIMLDLPHRPGVLNGIIAKFAAIDVNLTKLESRPVPGKDFEFSFIFEFEAEISDRQVRALLAELSSDPGIERFTFLGSFCEKQG
ncbi:MAG: chorismate mutase [Kiritimatiellae bacterium]|nr:chorismate mutase [Kiritimatiellia bacterium]